MGEPQPPPAVEEAARTPSPEASEVCVLFKGRRIDRFLNPDRIDLPAGTHVLVEAERGTDLGEVVDMGSAGPTRRRDVSPRRVLRAATPEEVEASAELPKDELAALEQVRERVSHFRLPMHLVDAEYQFDRNRVTFYFTADHRVDFRELVRDLAALFRTRIELRQIGTREAARRLGGLGSCGRELCCSSFLWDFERVTLQMAREQNLAINPARLSGLCGRLLCCLNYEECAHANGEACCGNGRARSHPGIPPAER